jgi:predicted transposase/invertase (TIGR01784 family)
MEKITPRIDIAFKKIFGVEENKDLLISLINSIVSEEDQVVDLTLLNPYNNKNFAKDKLSILDVKAKGVDGKLFNIEIQITDDADYDKRALYYWAKLYTEQLQAGSDYGQLSKAIGIHILNFISIPQAEKYHNVFHIHEKETGVRYFKDLELHTIELKKFSPNSQEGLEELVSKIRASIDIWAAFLTRHELLNKESLPSPLNNPELKKALGVLEVMNFGEEERDAYEERLKWLRVEANTLKKYEKKGREEGRAEGREEGRQEGRVEGEQIGLEKVALNMLQKGLSPLDIHELTGLDEKVIDRLCNNIMSPIK